MFMSHAFDSKVNVFGSSPSAVMTYEAGGWTLTGTGWPGGKRWFATRAQAHSAARDIADMGLKVFIDEGEPLRIKTGRFHLTDPRRSFSLNETRQKSGSRRRAR